MAEAGDQLDQAEQAKEAANDPFNRQVTLSIAIAAAVLAAVSMFGSNADNEGLLAQGEALDRQIAAAIKSNSAANKWAQYQANNVRSHMYKTFAELAEMQGVDSAKNKDKVKEWMDKHNKYENVTLLKIKKEAEGFEEESRQAQEEAQKALNESKAIQARADRFDYGELGLQLGVVLCSLAILTRDKRFWAAGLLAGIIGLLFGLSGFFGLFLGAD